MKLIVKLPHIACLLLIAGQALAAGDAAVGKTLYESRCAASHSMDYNGVGPAHRGVFGRKAGSRPGYTYSPAVTASSIVWNETTLDRWLAGPEQLIPGQKMGFSVADEKDRADLIAYLKEESAKKP